MSTNLIQEESLSNLVAPDSLIPLPPTDLIYDDGEPLESNRHRIAMNALIEAVHQANLGRNDYFAGGNMFIYFSSKQVKSQDFRGPDFFVVLDVDGTKERKSWILWEEQGRYPDVIVELISPTTANQDKNEKKKIYEQTFRTRNYFLYDPFQPESLQGWYLGLNGIYQEMVPDDRGWLWCEVLELWLGTWTGTILKESATWARFYDREGNLILLGTEKAEVAQANLEQTQADLEQTQADLEQTQANLEQTQAILEQERQAKEIERQKALLAESERANAIAALEIERQQQQKLRDRLQALGINID